MERSEVLEDFNELIEAAKDKAGGAKGLEFDIGWHQSDQSRVRGRTKGVPVDTINDLLAAAGYVMIKKDWV